MSVLQVMRVLEEPTAAAIAYGLHQKVRWYSHGHEGDAASDDETGFT